MWGTRRTKLEGPEARDGYGGVEKGREGGGAPEILRGGLAEVLGDGDGVECEVRVSLDCLNTRVGMADEYAALGGLNGEDLRGCLEVVARIRVPVSLTVASFDPALEGEKKIDDGAVDAVFRLLS